VELGVTVDVSCVCVCMRACGSPNLNYYENLNCDIFMLNFDYKTSKEQT